jgi:DNA-binding PadR family transcriptional regulator
LYFGCVKRNYPLGHGSATDCAQIELFQLKPPGKPKLFHGGNGFEMRYWQLRGDVIRAELDADTEIFVDITRQSGGRLYTNVPGHGTVQTRNLKTLFAQLALIAHARKLTESLRRTVEIKSKQQDDVLRAASDLARDCARELEAENACLVSELQSEKAANARLRDELEVLKRRTPRATQPAPTFASQVLVLRPELVVAVKNAIGNAKRRSQARNVAVILQQLSYLLEQGRGKILGDGRAYIYGTYNELQTQYFRIWSERTIERSFTDAERIGLIESKQPEGRFSRRKYYTLTPEGAIMAASGKMAASRRHDGGLKENAMMADSTVDNDNTAKQSHDHGPSGALNKSVTPASAKLHAKSGGSFLSADQHHDQPAQNHVKWPEFGAWCRKCGGTPTETGFWTISSRAKYFFCWTPRLNSARSYSTRARSRSQCARDSSFCSGSVADARRATAFFLFLIQSSNSA